MVKHSPIEENANNSFPRITQKVLTTGTLYWLELITAILYFRKFFCLAKKTSTQVFQYFQRQPPEVLYKKSVLRNFANLTGKHLCQSLFFNKVTGLSPVFVGLSSFSHNISTMQFELSMMMSSITVKLVSKKLMPLTLLLCEFAKHNRSNALNYFCKILHLTCSIVFWIHVCIVIKFSETLIMTSSVSRSSCSQMFFKIDVLKKFTNFTWTKLQPLLKWDPNTGLFQDLWNF